MRRLTVVFGVLLVLGLALSAQAQIPYRVLGESGAKVVRCLDNYGNVISKVQCLGGNEVAAQVNETTAFVDSLCQSCGYGSSVVGGVVPIGTGSLGTIARTVLGATIGASAGAGVGTIFGHPGTGAIVGGATGAGIGAISGHSGKKLSKKEQTKAQAEAQARAEAEDRANREDKLLRNRIDAPVRVILRSPDGRIENFVLNPGQTLKINPPIGTQLVLAEVETPEGQWYRLEYGRGKVKLPYDSGWEFGLQPEFSAATRY